MAASPYGVHRVLEPAGVLPQQAWRLNTDPTPWPDEVIIDVDRLNLDAASYRHLLETHGRSGIRDAVAAIVAERGKLHNPVTGSGGMLLGTVRAAGDHSPLGLRPGDRVATLVSLTLTPLRITDGLRRWNGESEQVPCQGTAVLFGRSIAAVLPEDLPEELALAVLDVCGAPALTAKVVARRAADTGHPPTVCVLGAAGKSGSLSLAAARHAGAGHRVGVVPTDTEASLLRDTGLADQVVIADARDPLAVAEAVGDKTDITVVCVDAPGCEHAAILATADGGTVIFFAMSTAFSSAALGAEGLAADVDMLIGNGYQPGHADYALDLVRGEPGLAAMFAARHRHTTQP